MAGDILQSAMAALPLLMPRRTVQYERGGVSIDVLCTPGSTKFMWEDDEGVRRRGESRNYLVVPSELAIDDVEFTPNDGDLITDTNDGETTTYIVAEDGGVSWRYVNRYHKIIRIMVKHRSEVE